MVSKGAALEYAIVKITNHKLAISQSARICLVVSDAIVKIAFIADCAGQAKAAEAVELKRHGQGVRHFASCLGSPAHQQASLRKITRHLHVEFWEAPES